MFQVDPKPIWQAYETLGDAAGTLGTAEETVQTVLGNLQSLRGFESAVERCRGRQGRLGQERAQMRQMREGLADVLAHYRYHENRVLANGEQGIACHRKIRAGEG